MLLGAVKAGARRSILINQGSPRRAPRSTIQIGPSPSILMNRTTLTSAALSLALLAPAARAQRGGFGGLPPTPAYPDPPAVSFPTDDPIIKRIWAIGMDSSHVKQLSQVLFDSIGPRLMGS